MPRPQPLVVLMLLTAVACGSGAGSYRGDGRARSTGSWLNPALIVEFDAFSLEAPYEALYRIEDIPSLRTNLLRLGISPVMVPQPGIRAPYWASGTQLGTLRFIVSGQSETLLDCETPISELSWRRMDGDAPFGTRKIEPCPTNLWEDALEDQEPLSITVRYTPGDNSPAAEVRVRIQAGGYMSIS